MHTYTYCIKYTYIYRERASEKTTNVLGGGDATTRLVRQVHIYEHSRVRLNIICLSR